MYVHIKRDHLVTINRGTQLFSSTVQSESFSFPQNTIVEKKKKKEVITLIQILNKNINLPVIHENIRTLDISMKKIFTMTVIQSLE